MLAFNHSIYLDNLWIRLSSTENSISNMYFGGFYAYAGFSKSIKMLFCFTFELQFRCVYFTFIASFNNSTDLKAL